MNILGKSGATIIHHFEKVVSDLATYLNGGVPDHKASGYFTLFDCCTSPGAPILICRFGICPVEKSEPRLRLSQEKSHRLHSHIGHVSSWQSRDKSQDKYGGAIKIPRGKHIILSFSGLPESVDEAAMLYLALKLEWLTIEEADEIAKISSNNVFNVMRSSML